jgi:outer membrane protein OmpA-like peptidoglycan-associated protein
MIHLLTHPFMAQIVAQRLITEEKSMFLNVSKSMSRVVAIAILALAPVALLSQVTPAAKSASHGDTASKWDIFIGYSYLSPHATVTSTSLAPNGTASYDAVAVGEIFSISYFFNRYAGLQAETSIHEWGIQNTNPPGQNGTEGNNGGFTTVGGGLVLRYPTATITPFAHVTGGESLVDGPQHNPFTWGPSVSVGGGLDYKVSHHVSIRLVQADYEYMNIGFPATQGGTVGINSARISAGIVFNAGSFTPPTPIALSCTANPASIYAGDPVTVTATPSGLDPKLNAVYTWGGSGVTGSGTTATVATAALTPGTYTVNCGVKEGKAGKEGLKPWETASASTNFTVKPFEPPTINCSANPDTIKPGETSTISSSGMSPQNRPLTYSYSATAGTVEGNGATAIFNSSGAPSGTASITCNVADDKGKTATANTSVSIMAPIAAPAEPPELKRLALHSIFFPTDQPRIEKPNGGLLASQEKILTTLATDFKKYLEYKPDAHLVLSGHADMRGSVEYNKALSERRVTRVKLFLVEQGVPEAKIETRGLGKEDNLTTAQVEEAIKQNPELNAADRKKLLNELPLIVLAKNRRVDVTLSTTGQQSELWYPFNAADALALIDQRNLTQKKATGGTAKKPVPPAKKK